MTLLGRSILSPGHCASVSPPLVLNLLARIVGFAVEILAHRVSWISCTVVQALPASTICSITAPGLDRGVILRHAPCGVKSGGPRRWSLGKGVLPRPAGPLGAAAASIRAHTTRQPRVITSVPPGPRPLPWRQDGDDQGQPSVSSPHLQPVAFPPLQGKGSPIGPRGLLLYRF